MHSTDLTDWREYILLPRDIETPGERSDFFARARRGEYTRLFRGVHIATARWEVMGDDERYRAIIKATAAFYKGEQIYSHSSAAALWRLPWIGIWPSRVHVTVPTADGGRSRQMFARHTTGIPEQVVEIEGVTVTTLARTCVDVSRTQPFGRAVTVVDAALRRSTHPWPGVPAVAVFREDLLRELEGVPTRQGVVKAQRVIHFANGLADRPGESMSRVSMHLAHLPIPELQVPLVGASGKTWTVDFYWRERRLIGEFDGVVKYTNAEFLQGRSPAEALIDEKVREDDLRAADYGMSRWGWSVAMSPSLIRQHLARAGLG
ncbi:MAG: hypothetical protein IT190_05600 [Microbacteriaceae bacterium]|nr:hypothetical protein [Microbacteriaceae bacterium]